MFNHTKTVCFFLTEQQFSPDLCKSVGQKPQIINRNITAFVSNTVNFKKKKFSFGNIKCRKIWHPHTNINIIHLIIWYLHAYTPMHTHRHMIQYAKLGSSKSLSKCLFGEVMLLSKHLLQYESTPVRKFTLLSKHEDLKMSYIIMVFHHMPSSAVLLLANVSYF